MSHFYLPSDSASSTSTPAHTYSAYTSDGDDEEDTLPYPAELSRNDFLAAAFEPQTYLSSLRNRHQTLEDLRADLRQRSQLLGRELLDLVNGNYEEFLSLGGNLRGGGEQVEGVRVGLLAFQREIEGVRRGVAERCGGVGELLRERKGIRRDIVLGRVLLEVDEEVSGLEERLGIIVTEDADEDEDDEPDAQDAQDPGLRRLRTHAQQYLVVTRLIDRMRPGHPFLEQQQPRLNKVRQTLLLDLSAALKQAKATRNAEHVLALVNIYGDLDAGKHAVKVLKGG